MRDRIKKHIEEALKKLQGKGNLPVFSAPKIEVNYPKNEKFGDYTTNISLVIGKMTKKNPIEIAEMIMDEIEKGDFKKIEIAAPGHINFYFSNRYLQNIVKEINEKGNSFGTPRKKKEKVMIEYSQPNTHKEFHVGHLRNVVVGNTLANVLKKSGYNVICANYIGDTGTHVAKCLWGINKLFDIKEVEKVENKGEFLGKNIFSISQGN